MFLARAQDYVKSAKYSAQVHNTAVDKYLRQPQQFAKAAFDHRDCPAKPMPRQGTQTVRHQIHALRTLIRTSYKHCHLHARRTITNMTQTHTLSTSIRVAFDAQSKPNSTKHLNMRSTQVKRLARGARDAPVFARGARDTSTLAPGKSL